jgi:hypothetical protein
MLSAQKGRRWSGIAAPTQLLCRASDHIVIRYRNTIRIAKPPETGSRKVHPADRRRTRTLCAVTVSRGLSPK